MKRDTDRKFLSISGLTDDKSLYHCKCTNQSNITYLIATICYYFVSVPLPIPIYASQTNWFLNLFLNYWLLKLLQNVLFHIPNIISTWKIGFKMFPLFTDNQHLYRQHFIVISDSLSILHLGLYPIKENMLMSWISSAKGDKLSKCHASKHCAKNNIYVALVLILQRAYQKNRVKTAASSEHKNLMEFNGESSLFFRWCAIKAKTAQD